MDIVSHVVIDQLNSTKLCFFLACIIDGIAWLFTCVPSLVVWY